MPAFFTISNASKISGKFFSSKGVFAPCGHIITLATVRSRAGPALRDAALALEVLAGIDYAIFPALLGVIVWWLTGRITWPARRPAMFFLTQLVLATLYSVIWLLLVLGSISLGTGFARAVEIAELVVRHELHVRKALANVIAHQRIDLS